MDYVGVKCSICEKIFDETDDIVVCPECGSPFHRVCYKLNGKCPNEENHGNKNSDWNDPRKKDQEVDEELHKDFVICPRCLHKNPRGTLFCTVCGKPLNNKDQENNEQEDLNKKFGFFGEQAVQLLFDPLGGVDPNEDFDGVSAKELSDFVDNNTQYYMREFKQVKERGKSRFNFAAFCFPPGWLLYRKQYKIGSFLAVLFILTRVILLFAQNKNVDFFDQLYTDLGLQNKIFLTLSDHLSVLSAVIAMPFEKQMIYWVPKIINVLYFMLSFVIGARANKAYMSYCINKIKQIKESTLSKEERLQKQSRAGGVNSAAMWLFLICDFFVVAFYCFSN